MLVNPPPVHWKQRFVLMPTLSPTKLASRQLLVFSVVKRCKANLVTAEAAEVIIPNYSWLTGIKSRLSNWPNSQIPECTCSISHNAPFRTEMCTFLFWMEHYGIWSRCILGFVKLVYYNHKFSSSTWMSNYVPYVYVDVITYPYP